MPIIYVYIETYNNAMRLINTLYRPSIDKESLCTRDLWEKGDWLELQRETEIWRICKKVKFLVEILT